MKKKHQPKGNAPVPEAPAAPVPEVPAAAPEPETSAGTFWTLFKRKYLVPSILIGVAVLLLLALASSIWFVPNGIRTAIEKRLTRLSESGKMELALLSCGRRNARIEAKIVRDSNTIFRCNDIRVRYSPWRIGSGVVKEIDVCGPTDAASPGAQTVELPFLPDSKTLLFPPFSDLLTCFSGEKDLNQTLGFRARSIRFFADGEAQNVPCAVFRGDPVNGWNRISGELNTPEAKAQVFYDHGEKVWSFSGTLQPRIAAVNDFLRFFVNDAMPGLETVSFTVRDFAVCLSEPDPWKRLLRADYDFEFKPSAKERQYPLMAGTIRYLADAQEFAGKIVVRRSGKEPALTYQLDMIRNSSGEAELVIESVDGGVKPDDVLSNNQGTRYRNPRFRYAWTGKRGWHADLRRERVQPSKGGTIGALQESCGEKTGMRRWSGSDLSFKTAGFSFTSSKTSAELNGPFAGIFPMACFSNTENGAFETANGALRITKITVKNTGKDSGSIQAGIIRLNGHDLGACTGTLKGGTGEAVSFSGKTSALEQNGKVSATLSFRDGVKAESLKLDFPSQKIVKSGQKLFEYFLPKLEAARLNGTASFRQTDNHSVFVLENGKFELPNVGVSAENLNLTLERTALPCWATPPGQKIAFSQLKIGRFTFKNGSGTFRISPDGIFCLESLSFGWCGGTCTILPFSFVPGQSKITFDCTGLNLGELLTQLGFGTFAGKGSVSGKLCLQITEQGKPEFTDGNFYSLPGEDGTLKGVLQKTVMSSGDGVAFAYEMIRDMQYRWVRLLMRSAQDGTLNLSLRFNGSPSNPLNYEPDLKNGGIRKSETPHRLGYLLLNLDEINLKMDDLQNVSGFFFRKP